MIRIRLRRVGAKGQPSYRIVVADSRSPRDGRFIEKIGFYNPRTQPALMEIDEARALHWLSQGAKPSDTVQQIMDRMGTTGRYRRLRAGEAVETLVAEAAEALQTRSQMVDQRTRRDDLTGQQMSKKAKAKVQAPAAETIEAPAADMEEAEVEIEAAAEIEEAPETEDNAEADSEPAGE